MSLGGLGEEVLIREIGIGDLPAISAIQAASPEASQWAAEEYLSYSASVAEGPKQIVGFVVWRQLGAVEAEILNLAVDPAWRGQGVGRKLVESVAAKHCGEVFLEVRESNAGARSFYLSLGFQEVGLRKEYYNHPLETAIVMKFHSC